MSFWNTTLPGVVATCLLFFADGNSFSVGHRDAALPAPFSMSERRLVRPRTRVCSRRSPAVAQTLRVVTGVTRSRGARRTAGVTHADLFLLRLGGALTSRLPLIWRAAIMSDWLM